MCELLVEVLAAAGCGFLGMGLVIAALVVGVRALLEMDGRGR